MTIADSDRFMGIRRDTLHNEVDGCFDDLEEFEDRNETSPQCESVGRALGRTREWIKSREEVLLFFTSYSCSCQMTMNRRSRSAEPFAKAFADFDFMSSDVMYST